MTTAQSRWCGFKRSGAMVRHRLASHSPQRSRLQVRIAQGNKGKQMGKVRALQRLLTHSYSGKVLAVRRVTENDGKETPGVDREIWDTPEKKTQAVHDSSTGLSTSTPSTCLHPKSDGKR